VYIESRNRLFCIFKGIRSYTVLSANHGHNFWVKAGLIDFVVIWLVLTQNFLFPYLFIIDLGVKAKSFGLQ